jgi:hypothetical protein
MSSTIRMLMQYTIYEPGAVVETFDAPTCELLVARGVAEYVESSGASLRAATGPPRDKSMKGRRKARRKHA